MVDDVFSCIVEDHRDEKAVNQALNRQIRERFMRGSCPLDLADTHRGPINISRESVKGRAKGMAGRQAGARATDSPRQMRSLSARTL